MNPIMPMLPFLMKTVFKRSKEAIPEGFNDYSIADQFLGYSGRILSRTKTAPEGETIYWNANVFTKTRQKIWYGDIHPQKDLEKLQRLAKVLNTVLYVLREHDGRFAEKLDFKKAVMVIGK